MTYDWEFSSLDCVIGPDPDGHTDIVCTVHWRLNARESGYSASDWGDLKVTYTSPDPFIPFADLTEADVQGWCEAGLDVDAMKVGLDARVAEQENPTTEVLDPPWQNGG
jgi:hypothetical protein|tara:strand:- start:88 stop:414 length:327 start_codon:yes stop_codon:yes gene_type:complete